MNYPFVIYGLRFENQMPIAEVLAMGETVQSLLFHINALTPPGVDPDRYFAVVVVNDRDHVQQLDYVGFWKEHSMV